MNEPPRRRRSEYDSGGGGLPVFPLVVVVIFVGLLLGGILAHFFSGPSKSVAPTPTITPVPQPSSPSVRLPSATPSGPATPRPKASVTSSTSPSPAASAHASPKPVSKGVPTAEPSVIILTPSPVPAIASATPETVAAPRAATAPKPSPSGSALNPAGATGEGGAAAVVRAYLGALMSGDRSAATGYLAQGEPTETFMQADARINSVNAKSNGDGSYHVTADVTAGPGAQEYFITFTVVPGPFGMQITEHDFIKPQ